MNNSKTPTVVAAKKSKAKKAPAPMDRPTWDEAKALAEAKGMLAGAKRKLGVAHSATKKAALACDKGEGEPSPEKRTALAKAQRAEAKALQIFKYADKAYKKVKKETEAARAKRAKAMAGGRIREVSAHRRRGMAQVCILTNDSRSVTRHCREVGQWYMTADGVKIPR